MIESKGFHMDRSKFARALLSVISPNHPPPSQAQGQQQSKARAEASNSAQLNTGRRSLSSAAAAMRAHKGDLASGRPDFSQNPTSTAPTPARPYNKHQPPKYGGVESDSRPFEEGSFVRKGTAQLQSCPVKPTAPEKVKCTSPYLSLRPEEDGFVPPPLDEDNNNNDRDQQHQLSLLRASKVCGSYKASDGAPQNGRTSSSMSAQTSVQTTTQGTYLGNGVWESPGQACQTTPQQQKPHSHQSQFSSQNNNGPIPLKGRRPQLPQVVPLQNAPATPSHNTLAGKAPVRPCDISEAGQRRPHSEAFGANRPFSCQTSSPYRTRPWVNGANNSSETPGARARNPFGASPFRVNSAAPQPQMPIPGTQKNVETLYSTPYLQVNSIEENSNSHQQDIAKNPLLNFDGIVLPIDTSVARRRSKYDPKTIARDILISTGRHPSERPLNRHLEPLKYFRAVDNKSDLSTRSEERRVGKECPV